MHLHLLLVAILQVITTTTVATFTGVDQLPTDALLYRGEIHTGNTPLPHSMVHLVSLRPIHSNPPISLISRSNNHYSRYFSSWCWHGTMASNGCVGSRPRPSHAACSSFRCSTHKFPRCISKVHVVVAKTDRCLKVDPIVSLLLV